jgi:hypothetical protein
MGAMNRRPILAVLALVVVASTQVACAETQAVVVVPQDEFPITMSPGVAPGQADGCDVEGLPMGRLRGAVYDIPLETRRLPPFASLAPVESICLDQLDVTPRRSVYPGVPGMEDRFRWFALDLRGEFIVRQDGLYYFRLTSDDGAQFFVDDTLVIDNDGYHPPRMALGAARLTAGEHTIHVPYYQAAGPIALVLEVARPGEGYHVLRLDQPL